MKVVINNKKENTLLHRTEIEGKVVFEGATPTRDQLRQEVAKQINSKPDLVVSKNIISNYGGGNATFTAFAYESTEYLQRIETKKWQKQVEKKEVKKEEAPAEEKKETPEKPVEEKKEEAPAEKPAEEKKETPEKPVEEKKEEAPAEKPAEEKKEAPAEEKKEAPTEKPAEEKKDTPKESPKEEAPAEAK